MNQRPNTDGIAPRTEPSGDERYRAFIENSTEGIWRLDFDPPLDTSLPIDVQIDRALQHGRLAECNTTMARMYGLSRPDELIGRTVDFMLPSPDESARHYLAAIIAAGYTVSDLESTGRDAKGGVRHFASTMIGVVVDGHLHRMWGTLRDISDRKRAELALRESEERLRKAAAAEGYLAAIISSADEAIVSKDLDGIIQWCNAAAERLFEYEAAELIGRPVRMLIPPERQSEEDDILSRLRRGERIERFETIRITKSGRRIDVALTVSPVRDASGTIIGASKIARDLSSQKQASSAQAFLAAIVECSDDAIIAKDLNGIIQSCNTAAERVFGYAASELIGRPVRLLIPQERQDEEDKILASIRRSLPSPVQ